MARIGYSFLVDESDIDRLQRYLKPGEAEPCLVPVAGGGMVAAFRITVVMDDSVEVLGYKTLDEGVVIVRKMVENFDVSTVDRGDWQCDHCQTTRNRNFLWIVRNEDGSLMQVGRDCLKSLSRQGDDGLRRYLLLQELLEKAERNFAIRDYRDDEDADCGVLPKFSRMSGWRYLNLAACLTRKNGFLSQGEAMERRELHHERITSTAEDIEEGLLDIVPDEQDKDIARKAVEWYLARSPQKGDKAEFDGNVREVLSNLDNVLKFKTLRLVTWLPNGYQKAMEAARKQKAVTAGEVEMASMAAFEGKEGSKFETPALFLGSSRYESHFAYFEQTKHIWRLLLPGGVSGVWFSTSNPSFQSKRDGSYETIERGDLLEVKGTVKKWDTYKGEPQVVFTRCRVKKKTT